MTTKTQTVPAREAADPPRASAPPRPARRGAGRRSRLRKQLPVYLGLAPYFVLMALFVGTPMVYGLAMSFTDWSLSSRGDINFVGLQNYAYVLGGDGLTSERFYQSLVNLAIYVPITVAVGLVVALALALIATALPPRLYAFLRAAYFVPTVLPLFLCVGIWQWLMNSESGLVASNLAKLGVGDGVNWVNTAGWAIAVVVLIDVWHAVGFNFIILSTGMQDISQDVYEAAEIDGANVFQRMTRITVPMLEPIIFFVVTYSLITALQVYDIPQILTSGGAPDEVGGPDQVMLFPVMEMVRNVHSGNELGLARAAAEGTVLMILIVVVTYVLFKLRRRRV
jgi:multiple sugar transport system permease protein